MTAALPPNFAVGIDPNQIIAALCRKSLHRFVKEAWSVVESAPFVDNWHVGAICEHLQAVTLGQIKNLLVNIPPGCSKSLLTSVFWPMWEWTRDATVRWFFASYDQRLSTRDSVKCRALLSSSWYRRLFVLSKDSQSNETERFTLKGDQNQKTYYETDVGGYRLATSVGGHGTGEHPDRVVVDDPHSVLQSESDTERQGVLDWWNLTMSTRGVARGARRVIIMQRLHKEDLSGVVLDQGGWEHICLPMRYEPNRMVPTCLGWTDPRKEEGELLTPIQFDEEKVAKIEKQLGPYGTAGQLQQRPAPRVGGMFKAGYFNLRARAAPYHARRVRSWDRAATLDGGCYTAGVLLAADTENYFVEHVEHGQWEPTERNDRILNAALRDRSRYGPSNEPLIVIEEEGGSTAADARKTLARLLAGFRVVFEHPTGSKDVRAEGWSTQLAAGNVYLVDNGESTGQGKADWDIAGFIAEHLLFRPAPGKRLGKYVDQVDASSQAFSKLANHQQSIGMRTYNIQASRKGLLRLVVCSLEQLPLAVVEDPALLIACLDPLLVGETIDVSNRIGSLQTHPEGLNGESSHLNGKIEPQAILEAGKGIPGERSLPAHALLKCLGGAVLEFADVQPSEHQERWDEPIAPFGKPCGELLLTPQEAKKAWSLVLRKRDVPAKVIVVCDNGGQDRRALSVAMALCDLLRLPREASIHRLGDENWKASKGTLAPSEHVFQTVKAARNLVLG